MIYLPDRLQTIFIDYRSAMPSPYHHRFCGEQHIAGAQCPNCQLPLLHYFTIDTRDPLLGLSDCPFPELPLLYCWRCNLYSKLFCYQILDAKTVKILSYEPNEPGRSGAYYTPYEDYPLAFPEAQVQLVPITPEQQKITDTLRAMPPYNQADLDLMAEYERLAGEYRTLVPYYHQFWGEPSLIQGFDTWNSPCPCCHKEMPFLASFENDCLDPRGFVGEYDDVQVIFTYCASCQIIGVMEQTD
ncbi:MAG TPA: hypothetical protein VHV83_17795 [Armatimonadota bacterium]|nr:hypothetical protein [Armatimonadota bacterium]